MPTYLLPAVSAYFLLALAGLIDKVLLKTVIVSPRAYAFFVGILGILALVFLPFGVGWPTQVRFLLAALLSGAVSVYALWAFYSALKDFEPSRVITAVGALTPVATLTLSVIIFSESLSQPQFIAASLLVLGGVLVSARANIREPYTVALFRHAVLAAGLFAVSFALLRFVFLNETFITGLFWSRMGSVLGAVSFVLIPENLRRIYWAAKKASPKASLPFLANQVFGGTGALLQTLSIALGSPTLVAALQGVQYAFLLVFEFLLTRRFPEIGEKFTAHEMLDKIVAVLVVGAGLYLLSIS